MNDRQLEKKVRVDAARVKKDISTLVGDSAVRMGRIENNVSQATIQARKDITSWAEDGGSQLIERFEKLTDEARKTMVNTAEAVKQDVGNGLSQYNVKVQEVADQVPGGIGKKAARYPWVTASIALVLGFILGILLKPTRRSVG